jgi:hypothetical protein
MKQRERDGQPRLDFRSDSVVDEAPRQAPPVGPDGLIARQSGPWAEQKLTPLTRYAQMVSTASRDRGRN